MRIRHVMKDGTTRDSIEGVVITNKEFYEWLKRYEIKRKERAKNNGKNHCNS